MRSLLCWVTQPVTIDASVPEADPENDASAGIYNKSISLSPCCWLTRRLCRACARLRPRSWAARFSYLLLLATGPALCSKTRSAGVAEIGLVLPQAVLDPARIGDVAAAKPEGVGRARGPLLGGAAIVLRRSGCGAKQQSKHFDRTSGFRNH